VTQHPGEAYSVDELAARVYLSRSQFNRKFKQYTGFSPHDYVIREKISAAKAMMMEGQRSMVKISIDLGFSSSQHFATVFRKYTGQSPGSYRSALG
jgi:transcriptional regulator GlxA family with amidase domain